MSTVTSSVTGNYRDQSAWPNSLTVNEVRNSLGVSLGAVSRIFAISISNADGKITPTVVNIHPMVNNKTLTLTPGTSTDSSITWRWGWSADSPPLNSGQKLGKKLLMKTNTGITLIELLIVIVIVGVLAAIAIPGYTNYMQRARRVDGKTALEQFRAAQEMFRAEKGGYSINVTELRKTWGVPTVSGDYNIDFQGGATLNANTFTAEAAPNTARQLSDGSLFINQDGVKTPADKWAK